MYHTKLRRGPECVRCNHATTPQSIKASIESTNSDELVAGLQTPVGVGGATVDDLCDEDGIVSQDVLVVHPASDAEPQPLGALRQLHLHQ